MHFELAMEEEAEDIAVQYFCYMFATLLESGVPILQALQTAGEVLPMGKLGVVVKGVADIRAGESLCPTLAESGFSAAVVQLVAVGEETGQLERMLIKAGDVLEAQIEARLQRALGME